MIQKSLYIFVEMEQSVIMRKNIKNQHYCSVGSKGYHTTRPLGIHQTKDIAEVKKKVKKKSECLRELISRIFNLEAFLTAFTFTMRLSRFVLVRTLSRKKMSE